MNGMGVCGGFSNGQGPGGNVMQGTMPGMLGMRSRVLCMDLRVMLVVVKACRLEHRLWLETYAETQGSWELIFGFSGNSATNPVVQPLFEAGGQSRGPSLMGTQIGGMTPQTQAIQQLLQVSQGLNNP